MNDDNIYINYQKQLIWFEEDNPENAPSEEERFWNISEDNPDNPFNNFIGNDKAIKGSRLDKNHWRQKFTCKNVKTWESADNYSTWRIK